VLLAAGFCAAGSQASAQTAEGSGPYRGLFSAAQVAPASATAKPATRSELLVRAVGAIEQTSAPASASGSALQSSPTLQYTGFSAEASRGYVGSRFAHEVRGLTQVREQLRGGGFSVDTQWLAAGVRALVTPRLSINASERFLYSPLFTPGIPSAGQSAAASDAPAEPGRGAAKTTNVTLASVAGVSYQFSRLASGDFSYGFDRVSFPNTGAIVSTQRTLAILTKAVRRDLSLQLKHSWLSSVTTGAGAPPPTKAQDLSLTVEYLPIHWRRTSVAVGVTPILASRQDPVSGAAGEAQTSARRSSIMLGGYTRIEHEFSRAWHTGVGYQRSVYYLPGYSQPILADAVSGSVEGKLGRWLTAAVSAGYSHGVPDLRQSAGRVTSMTTSTRLEWRPANRASLYVEVRRDGYSVSEGIPQLPGVPRIAGTASVRAGTVIRFGPSAGRGAER
jgi:hypothetical protein